MRPIVVNPASYAQFPTGIRVASVPCGRILGKRKERVGKARSCCRDRRLVPDAGALVPAGRFGAAAGLGAATLPVRVGARHLPTRSARRKAGVMIAARPPVGTPPRPEFFADDSAPAWRRYGVGVGSLVLARGPPRAAPRLPG